MFSSSMLASRGWGDWLKLLLAISLLPMVIWGGPALCLLCTLAVLQCSWCWGQWPSTESNLPIYPAVFGCCPSCLMVRTVSLSNQCLSPSPFFSPFKMSLAAKPPSAIVSPGWAHPFQLVCTINSARAWALGWKSRALHNFIFQLLCEKRHFLS